MPQRFPHSRSFSRILTTGSIGLLLTVMGCEDTHVTDRQLRDEITRAQRLEADQAKSRIEQVAARASNASAPVRALARSAQAHWELVAAHSALSRLSDLDLQARKLLAEIEQLAQQIAMGKVLSNGYLKFDPASVVQNVQTKIADAQGGPQRSTWISGDSAQIPTLVAARLETSRLEGQITERRQKIASLQQRRRQTLEEAERAAQSADLTEGEKALDEYRRASNLRREASLLNIEIDQLQSELIPLQQQLALVQDQQQAVTQAVQQFQSLQQTLEAGWRRLQEQSRQQIVLAQRVADSGEDPSSITGKAAELKTILDEMAVVREQALQHANNAVSFNASAAEAGADVVRRMDEALRADVDRTRKERQAWEQIRRVQHPSNFRLHQAGAERTVANLMLATARSQQQQLQVQKELAWVAQGLPLSIPQVLQDDKLEQRIAESLALAEEALSRADELLENISTGEAAQQLPHVDNAARIARVLTLYDRAQVARLQGRNEQARAFLAAAVDLRNELASRRVPLPAFPAELGQPPAAPAAPAGEGFGMAQ